MFDVVFFRNINNKYLLLAPKITLLVSLRSLQIKKLTREIDNTHLSPIMKHCVLDKSDHLNIAIRISKHELGEINVNLPYYIY